MSIRTLHHAFVLYPDNEYQMQLLRWLSDDKNQQLHEFEIMFILHKPESEEKKEHYHVLMRSANPRTADGVKKSFGVYKTVWRLYHMSIIAEGTQHLSKAPKGVKTLTGYFRNTKTKDNLVPVLTNQEDSESFVDVEYHGKERFCPVKPGLLDEIYKLTPLYTVPHVECVSDYQSYARYMLHQTYECFLAGKRQYTFDDLQGDSDFIARCFGGKLSDVTANVSKIVDAYDDYISSNCGMSFVSFLLTYPDGDCILEFIRKNPYFVSNFITGKGVRKNGNTQYQA